MTFAAMSGLCSTVTSGMLRNMDVYLAGMWDMCDDWGGSCLTGILSMKSSWLKRKPISVTVRWKKLVGRSTKTRWRFPGKDAWKEAKQISHWTLAVNSKNVHSCKNCIQNLSEQRLLWFSFFLDLHGPGPSLLKISVNPPEFQVSSISIVCWNKCLMWLVGCLGV